MSEAFEEAVLLHLDAAYNLARWLTRDSQAAEDVVQEASVRALKGFGGFRGENGKAWLLAIVRNTAYSWLAKNRGHAPLVELDEEREAPGAADLDPAALAERAADGDALRAALERLPAEYREAIALRELEGLSYQEIAVVAGVPIGTVMSRLSRARARLKKELSGAAGGA